MSNDKEQLSPNFSSATIKAVCEILPDEAGASEIAALFTVILDLYALNASKGLDTVRLAARSHLAMRNKQDDAAEYLEHCAATVAMLPRAPSGNQIMSLICMILDGYRLSVDDGTTILGSASKLYADRAPTAARLRAAGLMPTEEDIPEAAAADPAAQK